MLSFFELIHARTQFAFILKIWLNFLSRVVILQFLILFCLFYVWKTAAEWEKWTFSTQKFNETFILCNFFCWKFIDTNFVSIRAIMVAEIIWQIFFLRSFQFEWNFIKNDRVW